MRDVARFEDFFLATPSDPGCNTLKRGGCCRIRTKGVAMPYPPIDFILIGLSPANRTHPCRSRKIGEDDSDPPLKPGDHVAPAEARYCTPLSGLMGVAIVLMDPCGKAKKQASLLTRSGGGGFPSFLERRMVRSGLRRPGIGFQEGKGRPGPVGFLSRSRETMEAISGF